MILRMLVRLTLFITLIFALVSCQKFSSTANEKANAQNATVNKSSIVFDPNIKQLYDSLNAQNKAFILNALTNPDPEIRRTALYVWASTADTGHIYKLSQLLNDTVPQVRKAAAFAIGITRNSNAQDFLIKRLYNESDPQVKAQILESLGRIGEERAAYILAKFKFFPPKDSTVINGLAYGLVRLSIRGKTNALTTNKALKILQCENCPIKARRIISSYFLMPSVKVRNFYGKLLNIYLQENDPYIRANILHAVAQINDLDVRNIILQALNDPDAFIRVAALQAYIQSHFVSPGRLIKMLNDQNPVIARLAAEYFVYNGLASEANYYFDVAKLVRNWLARSIMFHAALKYASDSLRPLIAKAIITGYQASENQYEKAALLAALSYDPTQFAFVRDQTFYANNPVISTTGIRTLVKMRYNPNFSHFANIVAQKYNDNLYEEFSLIFKDAMRRGDNAMIYYAANILKNKSLRLIDKFDNTFFIKQALSKLKLPRDLKPYRAVCKLMELYMADTCPTTTINLSPINWQVFKYIKPNQKVLVKTSKGNFVIQLYINDAPIATAAFLSLVLDNYYNNTHVYRLIPNKYILLSSRRGDEWQDVNIVNNIQLSDKHFDVGTVGMQLVDKPYESVQWFITLQPIAQLDGQFTPIGKIVSGMNVVKKLDVSDQIFSVELY